MIDPADIDLIRANVDLTRLHGRRVLVTGGTGFVGRWMSLACPVTALNHTEYDAGEWERERWDYIIHLAMTPPDRAIACAKRCGARLLYSSSGAVFDERPGDYALEKQAGERAVIHAGGVVARMYTFCGAWMKNRYAVINMIHDGLAGDRIRIRSSNTGVTRSYLYAADMAVWLWRVLLDGQPGRVYEVGSPHSVTMMELAREVQRNFTPPVMIYHEAMMTREPRAIYLPRTAEVTMQELGLAVYTPFEAAIAKTVRYYREEARGE